MFASIGAGAGWAAATGASTSIEAATSADARVKTVRNVAIDAQIKRSEASNRGATR
jgi:hypothetical protein